MLNLFVQHTSCSLSINENYDPDVRTDIESILNHMVKERESYYEHSMEGPDDMPALAKCSLLGVSLTIPITGDKLNMGTWQGIYLCEFRNHGESRKIVATIYESNKEITGQPSPTNQAYFGMPSYLVWQEDCREDPV